MAGDNDWNGLELAIIGMACRFPGAPDVEAYWKNLRDGVESITFLKEPELEPSILEDPAARKDPGYVRAAAIVEGAEDFDASFFGIPPREAEMMDPQHRVFLECAWSALEDAGYDAERYRERIGVYAGARTNTYVFNLFSNPSTQGSSAFEVGLGNDLAFLSTRVSHLLNLRGPAYSLHTACSTALVAVHLAGQALLAGECRMALAGGVAIQTPQRTGYLHQFGGITSPDGHCRAFDAKAQGTLFGNGAGMVVLKRLEDALADGDTIHAIIRGSAINNDGSQKASFGAPSPQGQARVIRDALSAADVDARSITYVEAHGTGTQLGDPIEVRALTRAFRASTDEVGFCALGSVKTNIGHLDAAAGIASLIKAVLCLKHRELPPTLHFEQPNPQLELPTSPFFVNTTLRPWEPGAFPRRAGVSSFGIGGTNAHVILEEAPAPAPSAEARPWHLLALSARTDTALDTAGTQLAAWLEQHPEQPLADVAYTLQVGRQHFKHRRMAVVKDRAQALRVLRGEEPERVVGALQESKSRPVVFLFPGGGTQSAGMGAGLYATEPVFRAEVDRVAALFQPHLGVDLRPLLLAAPGTDAPELARNAVALPSIFLMEYALARLWMAWGVEPESMVGHSLGEYAAACLAGVLTLEDAVALVALRGRLMDTLAPGAMLSVSLPEAELLPLLGTTLDLAAVNAPTQCVASGPKEAVEALSATLTARGVEHRRLHVEAAAHSRMLDALLPAFREKVATLTLRPPERPYVSSMTGRPVTAEEVTRPEYWVSHLRQPVRFQDGLRVLLAEPARVLLEVGPGQSLIALARLQGEPPGSRPLVASMPHPKDPQPAEAFLQGALGRLWLAGVAVDWEGVHARAARRRVPLPTYPFERERFWVPPGERSAAEASSRAPRGKLADVADWFHLPSWKRTPPPALTPETLSQPRSWVVFTDGGPLATRLLALLEDASQDVVTVAAGTSFSRDGERRFTVAPDQPADLAALMRALSERSRRPEVFVHLWSLTPQGDVRSSPERFREVQARGYYSVLALAKALAGSGTSEPVRLEVLSNHVHDPDGVAEALPEKAPMLGVCKVLPQEQQHVTARCIDVVLPTSGGVDALASRLLAELATPSRDMMVAWRGDRRWTQDYTPTRLTGDAAPTRPLRERGVYLVTGGLGGVGLLLAEHLAETRRARLVLLGRSALPPRDAWDDWLAGHREDDRTSRLLHRVRAMESHGAEVLVLAADVADAGRMREVLSQVDARFGELHGVLHCAGVTHGDSLYNALGDLGTQASETQFRPKVHGAYVLEEVLRGRTLDFVLLFSSNAAVLGGLGYLAYASANLFLDAFAAHRARVSDGGTRWVSASWDGWPEETKHYAGFRTSMDQYAMTREEGADAVRRLVTLGLDGPVVVATGDLAYRLGVWIHRDAPVSRPGAGTAAARAARKGPHVPPANEVEQTLAAIWQEVLGVEQVGRHESFFDLGGHSLLATRVVGRLRSAFKVELPLAKLFEASTVAGLAQAVSAAQAEQEDALYRELLEQVASVPEDQLEAELARASGD
ncbi:acyltransferase domain-containing protein [Pyxidicoccus fallax]|uniref:Acyltransferase domain-containing protein n=1 Tax=Pyxidicoccus fallax TaxID=394095 RepID=A0A848LLY1_9BACT|nr:type I polyketide synthase [Pyxidicoccus fallax]NMO18680.1 acyltransferase domain-containing protein [Pyxidicoccus fallax]NPC79131.1 acyltransferase domain-containing protein [Pyxidicoccus fallax]